MLTMSDGRNSSSLPTRSAPRSLRALVGEVLAPGDHLHAEGGADLADLGAEIAEPEDAERLALQIEAERGLPAAAGPHGVELLAQMPRARPSISAKASSAVARPAPPVLHTVTPWALAASRSMEALRLPVVTSSLQLGQLLEQRARERRALAHDADDVELSESMAQRRPRRAAAR